MNNELSTVELKPVANIQLINIAVLFSLFTIRPRVLSESSRCTHVNYVASIYTAGSWPYRLLTPFRLPGDKKIYKHFKKFLQTLDFQTSKQERRQTLQIIHIHRLTDIILHTHTHKKNTCRVQQVTHTRKKNVKSLGGKQNSH